MKISRSSGYKSYGSIPRNEYTKTNQERSADAAVVLEDEPRQEDVAYKRRLIKRQSQHPAGRRKVFGWERSWKSSDWRAESAALQDEFTDMGRYYGYVKKSSRLSF